MSPWHQDLDCSLTRHKVYLLPVDPLGVMAQEHCWQQFSASLLKSDCPGSRNGPATRQPVEVETIVQLALFG